MDTIGEETLKTMGTVTWYNQWLLGWIAPYLGQTILEIGSGIGNFTSELTRFGEVLGIDINSDYIHALKKHESKTLHVGFGDIEKGTMFFGTKQFDAIVCLNVLEHINHDDEALTTMHFLMKKGGHLILLVPAHPKLYANFDKSLGHYRRYTLSEVEHKLHAAGFSDCKIRYINWAAAIGWYISMKVFKNKKIPLRQVKFFDGVGRVLLAPEKLVKLPFGLSVLAIAKK